MIWFILLIEILLRWMVDLSLRLPCLIGCLYCLWDLFLLFLLWLFFIVMITCLVICKLFVLLYWFLMFVVFIIFLIISPNVISILLGWGGLGLVSCGNRAQLFCFKRVQQISQCRSGRNRNLHGVQYSSVTWYWRLVSKYAFKNGQKIFSLIVSWPRA